MSELFKKMNLFRLFTIILLTVPELQAQTLYVVDASNQRESAQHEPLRMGNPGTVNPIQVNNRFLSIDGVPRILVMGEVHFTRVPKDHWESTLLKMKACGINVISTYVFWNHHEEIEGQFEWNGNKDLRRFVQLCAKHGLYVFPRIGPWCHGEARNGGTPDWILTKNNLKNRTNDVVYQSYVSRLFQQIGLQFQGLLYKDGGPIIGIQLENEYTKGVEGESHISWLKQTAIQFGMDVPLYTVTGWGNASVPKGEVIPLFGGYPDQPWKPDIKPISSCEDFTFRTFRDDDKIGNALTKKESPGQDNDYYPFFTCEMGVGVQITKHRRSIIGRLDGLAMAVSRVGSGSNLLGYYMFAGGSNPVGTLTILSEGKDETGNWSETPKISYDFQAAIRENGLLSPSYFEIKQLNYFLNEFGSELARMEPFIETGPDGFQYAIRARGNRAFLFGLNYCRFEQKPERTNVQFQIKLEREEWTIPSSPINIPDRSVFIWPINMDLDGVTLRYATAEPFAKVGELETPTWVFFQSINAPVEYAFKEDEIQSIKASNGKIIDENGYWLVKDLEPGLGCIISITNTDGTSREILTLTKDQARESFLLSIGNKKELFISDQTLYSDSRNLYCEGYENASKVLRWIHPESQNDSISKTSHFQPLNIVANKSIDIPLSFSRRHILDDALWLRSSVDHVDKDNELNHKLFVKEFNLANPSKVESAKLYLWCMSACRIRVNNIWVGQATMPDELSVVDLTGYVKKGENELMLDFPFVVGEKSFAARMMVEYFNSDRIEAYSDASWLMAEQYYYPAPLSVFPEYFQAPEISTSPDAYSNMEFSGFEEYDMKVPCQLEDIDIDLVINYEGDRAELRLNHRLIADNFNNRTPWAVRLSNNELALPCRSLRLTLFPIGADQRTLFDTPADPSKAHSILLESIDLLPRYRQKISIAP